MVRKKKQSEEEVALSPHSSNVSKSKSGGLGTHLAYVYPLYPSEKQAVLFRQWIGVCRFLWNRLLHHSGLYQTFKQTFMNAEDNNNGFQKEVTRLRADYDWIAAVPALVTRTVNISLLQAFKGFFSQIYRRPKFKKKKRDKSFTMLNTSGEVKFRKSGRRKWQVWFSNKIGWVDYRMTRQLPKDAAITSITVVHKNGKWHIAVAFRTGKLKGYENAMVGIDLGIRNSITLSDGKVFQLPMRKLQRIWEKLRKQKRKLRRMTRGSKRCTRQLRRIARLYEDAANIRKDFHHKVSSYVARRYGWVAVEDLKIKNMTRSAKGTVENPGKNVKQKSGLNKAILSQGWGMFVTMLAYKTRVVRVNPQHTSQKCHRCGHVHAENRNRESFRCRNRSCGFEGHADANAAVNVLVAGMAMLGQGGIDVPDVIDLASGADTYEMHINGHVTVPKVQELPDGYFCML